MEQKQQEVCCDQLPPLSAKYPWFVVQNPEDLSDQTFSTLHNPLFKYQCRIPELSGNRIQGCFHGWMILSNHPHNNIWSLWNPSTSNTISLPLLILKDRDYESVGQCVLSAPPDDPSSILLFTRTNKPTFVFCQLSPKRRKRLRKKPRWTEMSYSYQLKRMTWDGDFLHSLTCCNDLARDKSIFYNPSIASELGGYIHIRCKVDNIIYSYHLNYTTIVPSFMSSPVLPISHVSMWECSLCRLEDDHVEAKCTVDNKQEGEIVARSLTNDQAGFIESPLLNIPSDVLETIMEFCLCVEYMNLRATCKRCHLAAPVIQWSDKTPLRRLHNYSLVSPWLMVVEKNRGIITFTDPMLGDNYFMKPSELSIVDDTIHCSRFGWLLFKTSGLCVVFYNPFTYDLRELPKPNYCLYGLCFSAPPTSPDCMVVGFSLSRVLIHFVGRREQTWHIFHLGDDHPRLHTISFPTFYGRDLYALCNERELIVFKDLGKEDLSWKFFEAEAPISICRSQAAQYFLAKCDQHLLLVVFGGFGEPIEVFKPNDSTQEWEKINSIGKHMIYICNTTCLCTEAKTPEMENKVYLPQLSSTNKIVFYSLKTCTYHSFNGKSIQEKLGDIFTTTHLSAQAWIEPSWFQRPKRKRSSKQDQGTKPTQSSFKANTAS